ncbi:ceramide glucosyltransferase-B isoform X2 [Lingula anatina]|uniref:ceramide glucosyltransferase n=1 Tax=Lingula anatina TaxID=7574 RepID=A0A1S3IHS6_LINAN|nr:ceramide glucosyltransferase-B isoform X2 [Lingula anatina]|eukprot:XP_013397039.1 ceramide glucosyltransferase-B isoform X2 [Lingula anatina]
MMAPAIDYTIAGLAIFFFGVWCFLWSFHIVAIIYGKYKLYRKIPAVLPDSLPGVSILKPLTGVDAHLYDNLETYFVLNYPTYELLFCIQDESDPAQMVVRSLIEKYPKVDARILQGGKKVGINPKINNMMSGYEVCKYDLFMISDCNIKMKPDTLLDMVLHLKDDVGEIHQIPFTCDREDRLGFSSILEKVYFGTVHAKQYLFLNALGVNCTTGMSSMMRKNVLEEAGGLKAFAKYLAEDYFIAQAFLDRGWKVQISSFPALQNAGTGSVSGFQNRLVRWGKLRFAMCPANRIMEPFSDCLVNGINGAWSAAVLFNISGLAFFFVHLLTWFLLDYLIFLIMQNGPMTFSKFEFVVAWMFREITSIFILLKAEVSTVVQWRAKKFRLRYGGVVEEMREGPKQFVL